MTDRQLAEKMAEALEKALIPIACFQITDKQRPYTEIGPDMRTALNGAHDSIVEALAAFREAGEREKQPQMCRPCLGTGDLQLHGCSLVCSYCHGTGKITPLTKGEA